MKLSHLFTLSAFGFASRIASAQWVFQDVARGDLGQNTCYVSGNAYVSASLESFTNWSTYVDGSIPLIISDGSNSVIAQGLSPTAVVGYSSGPTSLIAFRWNPVNGSFQKFLPSGYSYSQAFAAWGPYTTMAGYDNSMNPTAFVWFGGHSIVNITPPGTFAIPYGIQKNNVVGTVYGGFEGRGYPAIWSGWNQSPMNLDPNGISGFGGDLFGVDGNSQVGDFWVDLGITQHPGLWHGTSVVTDLLPTGYADGVATAIKGSHQAGYVYNDVGFPSAALWTGTAGSFVNLGALAPAGISQATSIDEDNAYIYVGGTYLPGASGVSFACRWLYPKYTASVLPLTGAANGAANCISGQYVGGNSDRSPLIWNLATGTASIPKTPKSVESILATIFTDGTYLQYGGSVSGPSIASNLVVGPGPSGYAAMEVGTDPTTYGPAAFIGQLAGKTLLRPLPSGTGGDTALACANGQIVGNWSDQFGPHAELWASASAIPISLEPNGVLDSTAVATCGTAQGGKVDLIQNSTLQSHAALWYGAAASFVDLNPDPTASSAITAVTGGVQVGWEQLPNQNQSAYLWLGSVSTGVNLGQFAPKNIVSSKATGVSYFNGHVVIVGIGYDAGGNPFPLEWVKN